MSFVVLAPGASARACSIVHSHQESFGHELDVLDPGAGGLAVACRCGWAGVLPYADVVSEPSAPLARPA